MLQRVTATQLILISFIVIILAGCALLLLPQAATDKPLSSIEALFTATSATCVTGLTVIDIGTRLTLFGQIVVLMLIQIGGLGIMTFSTFFIYLLAQRFSIRSRAILEQTLSQHPVRDMASLLLSVFVVTIVIEVLGALFLWLRFKELYPTGKALYLALFHATSAFCNAGFSLFPNNLMDYQGDVVVNLTIIILIILGGLGFVVIFDVIRNYYHKDRVDRLPLNYHTRIVLNTSGLLIVCGTIALVASEWFNTMESLPLHTRFLSALFQSVTSRTCGFNTLDIGKLTDASLTFIVFLMFIGASPLSTGGGVKTSTIAVIMALIISRFHNEEDVTIYNRRIALDVISRAVAVTFFAVLIISTATIVLLLVELQWMPHAHTRGKFLEFLFEVTSAFGTVGLTTGITMELSPAGKFILIILMYTGRVGPLTIAMGIAEKRKKKRSYRLPEENILIG